jgi:hypothetical protein
MLAPVEAPPAQSGAEFALAMVEAKVKSRTYQHQRGRAFIVPFPSFTLGEDVLETIPNTPARRGVVTVRSDGTIKDAVARLEAEGFNVLSTCDDYAEGLNDLDTMLGEITVLRSEIWGLKKGTVSVRSSFHGAVEENVRARIDSITGGEK